MLIGLALARLRLLLSPPFSLYLSLSPSFSLSFPLSLSTVSLLLSRTPSVSPRFLPVDMPVVGIARNCDVLLAIIAPVPEIALIRGRVKIVSGVSVETSCTTRTVSVTLDT